VVAVDVPGTMHRSLPEGVIKTIIIKAIFQPGTRIEPRSVVTGLARGDRIRRKQLAMGRTERKLPVLIELETNAALAFASDLPIAIRQLVISRAGFHALGEFRVR